MRRIVCSLLLMSAFLAAEEGDSPYSLVDYLKSPIPRAAGSVNVISGDWVDQTAHCETTGPDPYVVAHSYSSATSEEGTLADGWDFFHPSELEVHQPNGITYNEKSPRIGIRPPQIDTVVPSASTAPSTNGLEDTEPSPAKAIMAMEKGHHHHHHHHHHSTRFAIPPRDPATLFYREAGGSTVVFETDDIKKGFHPNLKNVGYSVVSSIDQPSRRSAERTRIEWVSSGDLWVVELEDGTKRTYSRVDKNRYRPASWQENYYKRLYHIHEERLPSGNRRRFHYDKDKELSRIDTLSSDERFLISSVTFHRHSKWIDAVSSEGLTTRFHFKKIHDRETARVVRSIDRPGLASLQYEYAGKDDSRRVCSRITAGRTDVPEYFHSHRKGHRIDAFSVGKVRKIKTKDFSNKPLSTSHSFSYLEGTGCNRTKVHEADGSATAYSWDTTKLPHQVRSWDASGALIRRERFVWDGSRLSHRAILDSNKNPILDQEFIYDDRNNVVCEHLHGLFTGHVATPPSYDSKERLIATEYLTRSATYDGRSLKTGQVDPLGNWIYYEYEPDRELLTARFTCDQTNIIRREFFQYNSAAVCTQSSIDDGSSRDPNDMTGVTRRTTSKTTMRSAAPRFGAPEEIWTYIWTPEGGEKLAHVELFIRNDQGLAVRKELCDANLVSQKHWSYGYDQYGRTTMTCNPDGSVEEVSYDGSGRVASRTSPEARTTLSYDLLDRLIEERKTYPDGSSDSVCYQYDLSGRLCTKIDGRGRTTTTTKDILGRTIRTDLPAIATEAGAARPCAQTRYDGLTEYHTSPSGATTTIVRSASGNPFSSFTPGRGKTTYFYDALNRLVEQHDPSGSITYTSYDALDRVLRVEKVVDGVSVSIATTVYRGSDVVEERDLTKAISYTYDAWGRRNSEAVTDLLTGQSLVSRTEYDALHRPVRIIHETLQTEERITYDVRDRELERRVLGSDGSLLSITTKAYDLSGRVIEEGVGRNGTIAKTRTTYGAFGLPSSITYPDSTATMFEYNPLYLWADGHTYLRKTVRDARGVLTELLLDSNDQARRTTVFDPFGTVISKNELFFSLLGHPTRVDDAVISQGQLSSTITTQLEYDASGLCTSCTLAANSADAATWTYLYDDLGRKSIEVKPSGLSLSYSYDHQGRLSTLQSSDSTISWAYSYNNQNLPESITDRVANGVTRRSYNGLGALLSEELQTSLTMGFELLPAGLVSSITYPDGSQSCYSYAFGRLSSVSRNGHAYTVNSRDLSGLITDATLPDACGHVTAALDLTGRHTLISHPSFSEERTLFDPVGSLLERSIDGQTEVFGYDFLCQLTNDNGRSALYDSLHNRIETEGMAAVHNNLHQMLSQGNLRYSYDLDGRRISDDSYRYTYDALDRLVCAENASVRYDYAYDPFNRRLSTTAFSNTQDGWVQSSYERYLWQGDREVGSVDDGGNVLSLRVLGEGLGAEIGSAVLFEINGTTYIPLHDLCGHVRVLLTSDGQEAERLTYTAYKLASRTSTITPWTFSSKRQDATGFIYFGQRYYDPQTATWLTLDPLGNSAGPNLYAYVKNNPLTYFDLQGLFGESFGQAVSDVVDAVCGAFSSVVDFVCDVFSGIANSFSGGSSSEEKETDWSAEASKRIEQTKSQVKKSSAPQPGRPEEKKHLTQTILHPQMSPRELLDWLSNQSLEKRLLVYIPGAGTTEKEAIERAEELWSLSKGTLPIMTLYNATEGIPNDVVEAAMNCLGFELVDGTSLREQFTDAVRFLEENGVSITAYFICHSQGVAIGSNILKSSEFRPGGSFNHCIGKGLCLGGPKIIQEFRNCIAIGDPVGLCSLANPFEAINASAKGNLSFVCSATSDFPHNFNSPHYQKEIRDFICEICGGG